LQLKININNTFFLQPGNKASSPANRDAALAAVSEKSS
jgi:hypothetical protein